MNKPSTFSACRDISKEIVGEIKSRSEKDVTVRAFGHCHIDTAWLWPFAETRRKVARSWTTQMDLMDRYPDYRMIASQAQQYQWLKEDYPALFAKLKVKVKAGQFIPVGGSWVESETHCLSGESLVRQFIFGQRFFKTEFGERCKVFFLPDTFGFNSQIPQVLRLAGITYFMNMRMGMNQNRFPNTTFNWVGLDGSQVLCHIIASKDYNGQVTAAEIVECVNDNRNLGQNNNSVYLFGNGDGGGGPVPAMLEKLKRFEHLSDNIGGLPKTGMFGSFNDFFEQIEKSSKHGKELPTWHGELYLEDFRGTYTTQAKTKKYNRTSETLLREVEYLCLAASLKGSTYPTAIINQMWEDVLLCQFHDVLPGSSIGMVYKDSDRIYEQVCQRGQKLFSEALATVGSGSGEHRVLNTLTWPRAEITRVEDSHGLEVIQKCGNALYGAVISNGLGCNPVEKPLYLPVTVEEKGDSFILNNRKLKVTVRGGLITSLFDIELQRELVPKGCQGNQLILYDDQPIFMDAWSTEAYHLEKYDLVREGIVKVVANGPLRASLQVEQQISETSRIKSVISLDAVILDHSSPTGAENALGQLEVSCEVDWNENRKFLKVEFPWDLHSDTADYET